MAPLARVKLCVVRAGAVALGALTLVLAAVLAPAAGAHPPPLHPDRQIWASDRDGHYIRHFTSGHGWHDSLRWSPDGRRAALLVSHWKSPGPRTGISQTGAQVVTRTGRVVRRFYETEKGVQLVGWSPDGRRLMLIVTHDLYSDTPAYYDRWLVTLDVATGERHVLTHHVLQTDELVGAGWSPNGRRVAFVQGNLAAHAQERPLVTVSATGRGRRVLARDAYFFEAWTKKGIYYDRPGGDPPRQSAFVPHELRLVDPGGGAPRTVLAAVSYFGGASPDGEWLVYRRRHPGGIWMARADGSERRKLTQARYRFGWAPGDRGAYVLDSRLRLYPTTGGEHNVARVDYGPIEWSPDGRWIAWERDARTIAVMDEHGRHRHIVLRAPWDTEVGLLNWMPDADTLMFVTGYPED